MTHYEVLGVERDASHDEIKKAFQRHQRKHHPDIAGPGSEDEFIAGQQAASVLLDDEARAAYDDALANPAPTPEQIDDEPIDAWVNESVDMDASVDEPTPEPVDLSKVDIEDEATPDPDPDGPTRVTNFGPDALVTVLAACAATCALALAVSSTIAVSTVLGIGVIALVVATVAGYRSGMSSRKRSSMTTPVVIASSAAAALVAYIATLFLPSNLAKVAVVAPLAVGAITGLVVGSTLAAKRRDAMFLKTKDVEASTWFGSSLPGELPAYLERELANAASKHMRIFRLANAPFSHLIVSGTDVYLLRNIAGSDGTYYFSGPSLLFEDHAGNLSQVLAGDFSGFVASMRSVLGKKVAVHAAVTVMAERVGSHPGDVEVIALSGLREFLAVRPDFVNRSVMIDSVVAAAQIASN